MRIESRLLITRTDWRTSEEYENVADNIMKLEQYAKIKMDLDP